jgi:cathepsin A (carboxypeptidase C)
MSNEHPPLSSDIVTNLPGLPADWNGVQYAGMASIYGDANPQPGGTPDQQLFYWFVGTTDYAKRPTLLWTNGGPGASSFWGFFFENGPFTVSGSTGNWTLTPRASGWNNQVNYLIIEHPLGVTYSQPTDPKYIPSTPEQGALEYYQALVNFMAGHEDIACMPILLAGESYAGTYLPLLASHVVQEGGPLQTSLLLTVLADAWVDPINQMKTDTTYALAHGLISQHQKSFLDYTYTSTNPYDANSLNNLQSAIGGLTGVYLTNTALTNDPDTSTGIAYLNDPLVLAALNVPAGTPPFQYLSSDAVWQNYKPLVNKSYRDTVDSLLASGANIMIVSGLNDGKDCNFLGTAAWLGLLEYNDAATLLNATPQVWMSDGTLIDTTVSGNWPLTNPNPIGFYQNATQLSWVKILNAGHMAALDQPLLINLIMRQSGWGS